MDEFTYSVPAPQARTKTGFLNKEKAQAWADELPLADASALPASLISALAEINQSNLDIIKRFEVLEVMRSLTRTANENLEKNYLRVNLPLSPKASQAFASAVNVLQEMAQAYLILVEDILKSAHPVAIERMLPYAIYHAISYLARLLISHYVVYRPAPKGVWRELHKLYMEAAQRQIEKLALKIVRKQGDVRARTIDSAYKRILMASQATPYHLMQGEVNSIYNLMEHWSAECHLTPLPGDVLPQQSLILNWGDDEGPQYMMKDRVNEFSEHIWLIKCDGVRQIINKKIRGFLAPATSADKVKHTLSARLERDMYFRLSDAWAVRREREHERISENKERTLVVGLNAFHFHMSDGAEFSPERVEVSLKKHVITEGSGLRLELVASDDERWKWEREAAAVEAGMDRNRLSDFERAQDTWENIHANQARHQAIMRDQEAKVAAQAYRVKSCMQVDKSSGGLKLFANAESEIQLKAGEIIGLSFPRPGQKDFWRLASVRWVMSDGADSLNFGVKFISDDAKPMAARGVGGAGAGGEYIRTLIVPDVVHNRRELTLVAPAAVYDLDSEVVLNNGKELRTIRLVNLVETTNSFSRFKFDVVE